MGGFAKGVDTHPMGLSERVIVIHSIQEATSTIGNVVAVSTIGGPNGVVIKTPPLVQPMNVLTMVDTTKRWAKMLKRFNKIKLKDFIGSGEDDAIEAAR